MTRFNYPSRPILSLTDKIVDQYLVPPVAMDLNRSIPIPTSSKYPSTFLYSPRALPIPNPTKGLQKKRCAGNHRESINFNSSVETYEIFLAGTPLPPSKSNPKAHLPLKKRAPSAQGKKWKKKMIPENFVDGMGGTIFALRSVSGVVMSSISL